MKKEILKEIREPGKSRKKKGQPKGRRNGFLEGLTGKDFTAAGLFFFSLLLCRLFVLQYGVFGSSIDWISQHSTLADYFRKRFYATGNLFPDFAWNLGGGQNIYRFAYYGLLSPTMLLSYLFPFIPMDLWVMGSSALLYAADAVLFYRWISKKGLHYGNCLFTSLFFTCSTALLYHSYNQLMFVNYMPFLLLALLGVDRHFQKRKSGLLILSVLGMILTSFYFSVGGLLALTAYAVTEYLKCGTENAAYEAEQENRKVSRNQKAGAEKKQRAGEKSAGTGETLVGLRSFFGAAIRFALPVLAGILLSGILLIPSAAALFGGSGEGGSDSVTLKIGDNWGATHPMAAALDTGEKQPAPPMVKMKRPRLPKPEPIGKRYVCGGCGYEYIPELGDPDGDIAPGTLFEKLPEDWVCPECAEPKDQFIEA